VITTPNSPPVRRTVTVTRTELNQAILDFRLALQDPSNPNIKPQAQKLYNWLVQPIEADLKQANTQTIIYAPDGQLRYIPLAALHDGTQWLIQRLRVNNITAKSFTNLTPQAPSALKVLAGAFAKGQYQFQVGTENFHFKGLLFAGREVNYLVATVPGTTSLFDLAFNLTAFTPRMNEHSVLHLATHAAVVIGQPQDSFILFGDGERATLQDIRNWTLNNVELVVLSACETGLGDKFGNGEEILGLGYQFQDRGVKATIASLWAVNDGGTQLLMNAFYDQLNSGKLSKVEALRQAQVALIEGKVKSTELNLTHPAYWASFILIGNGL
jgi:CHAT domain-containing protein